MRNNRRVKKAQFLLLVILSAFLFSAFKPGQDVFAQEPQDVTLGARAGFDGYCKDDRWLPVHVEVENAGPDLDASIKVSYENSNGGETSTTTNIQLPTSSRKALFLYIFADSSLHTLTVSVFNGRKVLQEVNLRVNCLTDEVTVVGSITDTPAAFDWLADIRPLGGAIRVAQLRLSDLPDRPQAWQSLGALVLSNVDTSALTAAQLEALQAWLRLGGRLFITGGPQWQITTSGVDSLLPIEIQSTRRVTGLSSLSAYLKNDDPLDVGTTITVGKVRSDSQILVEQDGDPILVQRPIGFGTVYYLSADPTLQPLSGWSGMAKIYEQTLATRPPLPPWLGTSVFSGYQAEQALGAISELSMPSILYICTLLGLYVVIIGPLNFFVLRRLKRRELAWGTIPLIVVIFSCLLYGLGFSYRGTRPILNRLLIVQAWDGVPQAEVRALVGVFSPVRGLYDLEAGPHFMPRSFYGTSGDLQANNAWAVVQQDASMIVPDTRVEIAGMKAFVLDGSLPSLPLSHNLAIDLSAENTPVVKGTIENNSEYTLRDVIIVSPGSTQKVSVLEPGESVQVTLSLNISSYGPAFYTQDAMSLLGLSYTNIERDVAAARQSSFLTIALGNSQYLTANRGNWGIYLLGWLDQSDLPVGIVDKNFETVDTVLYIHNLVPNILTDSSALTLPSGFFAWESSSPTVSPYDAWDIPSGGYILRFTPAVPIAFRSVSSLKLTVDSTNNSELITYAWDVVEEAWVRLPRTGSAVTIPEPDRFVASNGEVRIKIVQKQSTYVDINSTSIRMVVEP